MSLWMKWANNWVRYNYRTYCKAVLEREKGTTILYDLRSSWVVPEEIKAAGGIPYRERIGHAYMRATLRGKKPPLRRIIRTLLF